MVDRCERLIWEAIGIALLPTRITFSVIYKYAGAGRRSFCALFSRLPLF